jgi:hypothetical protein
LLSLRDFSHFALDFLLFSNAFLEQRMSVNGNQDGNKEVNKWIGAEVVQFMPYYLDDAD